MTPTPPKSPAQQEEETLELVKLFFYVYSALVALSTLVVAAIFAAMAAGMSLAAKNHGTTADAKMALGLAGVVLGSVMVLLVAKVVAVILAGRFIGERTHYTFVFVVAIICMINVPFGTALGAFTLVTLTKEPIKRRFSA